MNNNSKTIVALLAGLASGAALGILFAPGKGEETLDKLSRSIKDLKDRILGKGKEEIDQLVKVEKDVSDQIKSKSTSVKSVADESANDSISQV